jgi:hypothetical protein
VSAPSAPPGRTAPPSCQRRRRPLARLAGGRGRDRGAAAVRRSAADRRFPDEAIGSKDRCHFAAPRLERELSSLGQTAQADRLDKRRMLGAQQCFWRHCNGPSTALQTLAAVTVAEPPIGVSEGASLILSLSSGPGPARPAEAGGGTALDLLPCRRLPFTSTCSCPQVVLRPRRPIHRPRRLSTQCNAACHPLTIPSHPLCRQQRSGDSEQTIRRDLRLGIAAPAPKQITSRTDRPPSVDRISASGPAVYCRTLVPVATSTAAVSRL